MKKISLALVFVFGVCGSVSAQGRAEALVNTTVPVHINTVPTKRAVKKAAKLTRLKKRSGSKTPPIQGYWGYYLTGDYGC